MSALLAGALAAVVFAHPFGDPQTADVTSTDTGVRVHWQAAPDDITALAITLGVLDGMRTFVFENGALVPEESDDSDGMALAESSEFAPYVLEHIHVSARGSDCKGVLLPVSDVLAGGATVDFDCGGPVESAEVTITMLTDLHEAYRTMAHGPGEVLQAYSSTEPTHTWAFDVTGADAESGDAGFSAALQIGGVLAIVAAMVTGLFVLRRRARHRD